MNLEKLQSKKLNRYITVFLLLVIAGFAFYVNREIRIKGLYMDDLYMWSFYGEQNLWEFTFPIGVMKRYRPVSWFFTYLQMAIVGSHIQLYVVFNIIVNILIAWTLFYLILRISKSRISAFFGAICYLASRFAYYQIGQVLGLMESMALWFAILILYRLIVFAGRPDRKLPKERAADNEAALDRKNASELMALLEEEPKKDFKKYLRMPGVRWQFSEEAGYLLALILYFLLAFTHERYIALLPLFYAAVLLRLFRHQGSKLDYLKEKKQLLIAPAVVLILIFSIRGLAGGRAMPAGTGGTQVTETFSVIEAIGYCISQVLYLFGVNAGPEHLCGIPWEQTPPMIKRCVKFSVLFCGLIAILFTVLFIRELVRFLKTREKKTGERLYGYFGTILLIVLFIGLCIACSSVTIRVEMRWIYVSYAAMLMLGAYMVRGIREMLGEVAGMAALLLFVLYALLSIYTNLFGRSYFGKLYFWPDQLRMNSLCEQTIEKYGRQGVFGKDIYILENSYGMSDFYAEYFFKTYDPKKQADNTRLSFINSVEEIPESIRESGQFLVLRELPESDAYLDITDEVRNEKQ